MDWPTAILCGALGGCVIEAIAFYGNVSAWQTERRRLLARPAGDTPLPTLRSHIDLPADSLVFLTRLALGAIAGALFHPQIIGMTAAVAVGASAPALLRQLGTVRPVQEAIQEPGGVGGEGGGGAGDEVPGGGGSATGEPEGGGSAARGAGSGASAAAGPGNSASAASGTESGASAAAGPGNGASAASGPGNSASAASRPGNSGSAAVAAGGDGSVLGRRPGIGGSAAGAAGSDGSAPSGPRIGRSTADSAGVRQQRGARGRDAGDEVPAPAGSAAVTPALSAPPVPAVGDVLAPVVPPGGAVPDVLPAAPGEASAE